MCLDTEDKLKTLLIAPDSFKGSLSAIEFCSIANETLGSNYNIISCPIADGGEGSLDVLQNVLNINKVELFVSDPIGREVKTWYLYDNVNKTAYIELAKASGLDHVKENPDVMNTSTFGTGELIKDAIENRKATNIILFIGGSATNDAAMGIATALGAKLFDTNKNIVSPLSKNLIHINSIDLSLVNNICNKVSFTVAVDVDNPFFGENGAAYVYGPQKGAAKKEVALLDSGLKNIANIFNNELTTDVQNMPGSGAAGGVGGGMVAMLNAKMVSGAEIIFESLKISEKINSCDLVITGEGKIDSQTLNNKLIYKLSQLSKKLNKPISAVCGYFDGDINLKNKIGLKNIVPLASNRLDIPKAINESQSLLKIALNDLIKKDVSS